MNCDVHITSIAGSEDLDEAETSAVQFGCLRHVLHRRRIRSAKLQSEVSSKSVLASPSRTGIHRFSPRHPIYRHACKPVEHFLFRLPFLFHLHLLIYLSVRWESPQSEAQQQQQQQRDANADRFVAIGASTPSIEPRKSIDGSVDRFVAIGASTQSIEPRKSNESSVASQMCSDYDWKQLQRYAIYGCFMAGPILHGW